MILNLWSSYRPTICNHFCSWDQFFVHSFSVMPLVTVLQSLICTEWAACPENWLITHLLAHSLTVLIWPLKTLLMSSCLHRSATLYWELTHYSFSFCTKLHWGPDKSLTATFIGTLPIDHCHLGCFLNNSHITRAIHWPENMATIILIKAYLHIVIDVGKTAVIPFKLLRRGFSVSYTLQTVLFLNFELSMSLDVC